MEFPTTCQHCGKDVSDEWLEYEASWDGDVVTQSLYCPHCEKDMLSDTPTIT